MTKKNKKRVSLVLIVILLIILLCTFLIKGVYAADKERITVTNWTGLKNAIENSEYSNIEIQLSKEVSNNWEADSKIVIPNQKIITLVANYTITIKRANSFLDTMIENNGSLSITTASNEANIIFDGNKENVQATGPLIRVNGGVLNISNAILLKNNNNGNGGAIYSNGGELEISNATFSENEANTGGAIYVLGELSNTKLNNIKITNNRAKTASGGGVYAYGNLVIEGDNNLISGNVAQTFGGGLMIKTTGSLSGGEISNNQALSNAGGGIRIDGTFTLNGGTINNNTANTSGGGVDWTSSTAEFVFNSGTIENNIANGGKDAGDNVYPYSWKDETEKLNIKEIDAKLIKYYLKGSDNDIDVPLTRCGLQGMTESDKYIILAMVYTDNSLNTNMVIIDKNTMEILNIDRNYCFGHANGMTYNPNNDRFYVAYSNPNDNLNYIGSFKIGDNYEIKDLINIQTERKYGKITYNSDDNYFICASGRNIYIMDDNWNEIRSFIVYLTIGQQDITYYNGYIYYNAWESGSRNFHNVYDVDEKNSNLLYVYDLEGNLQETLYISNKTVNAELEDIYIEPDGKMILAYNGPFDGPSLYKSNYLMEKIKPEVTVNYSTENRTNQDVTVTLTANEPVEEIEGWQLSNNKMVLTKDYKNNTVETVEVTDLAGNITEVTIKIENIDKVKPILNINYSTTLITNKDVTVTITANEEIQNIEGWTLSNDKKILTKTYSENKTELIIVKDLAGNETRQDIEISNIDKIPPEITISYSTTESTKNPVIAILTSNEKLQELDGWELSGDKRVLSKEYIINTSSDGEIVTVKDIAGNEIKKTVIILNIEPPDEEPSIESSKYEVKDFKISNISPDTKISDLKNDLIIVANDVKIYNSNNEIVDDTDISATGMRIVLNSEVEYILIVKGDANGDGTTNLIDLLSVNKHRLSKVILSGVYFEAGDINGDNIVDLQDLIQINRYRLGKTSL